jgi:hypothetical protein
MIAEADAAFDIVWIGGAIAPNAMTAKTTAKKTLELGVRACFVIDGNSIRVIACELT